MEERTGCRKQNESQIIEEKKNGRLVGATEARVVNLGPVYTIPGSGFPGILDL